MENNEKAYYEKVDIDNELKLRKQLAALPPYCKQYFIAIESKTQSRTRLAYAYDLSCFFDYLHENNPICKKMTITEIPLSILESLKPMDLEEYLYNLKVYEKDGMAHTNEERGIKRKLSSLRSFYKYLYKNEFIQSNPASKVSTPKIHDKNIIRLDADEVANLLDEVESGENLTKKQQMFHDRTKVRDLALLTLMLGTGIRVLECVGLDAYVGFLHRDRPGRESLALDLMEELRPCFADRFVLTMVNNRIIKPEDFDFRESGAVFLSDTGRKSFLHKWQERKRETITHPFLEEKLPWGLVPYVQSLLLARYLRGDLDDYPPFLWK